MQVDLSRPRSLQEPQHSFPQRRRRARQLVAPPLGPKRQMLERLPEVSLVV